MKTSEIQIELNRLRGSLSHTERRAIIQTVDASGAVIGQFYLDGEPAEGEPLFTMLHSFFEFFQSEKRFLCAYSGRAAAKSWSFAIWLLANAYESQMRILFLREKQNSLQESVYHLLREMIQADPRLLDHFDILSNKITAVNGSEFVFKGLQSFTASSIKSFEGFDIAYVDEAQALSRRSLDLLLPTIRKKGSKVLFGLNPENSTDPVYSDFVETERPDTEKRKFSYENNPYNSFETLSLATWDRDNTDVYNHRWLGAILIRSELRILTNWKIWDFNYKAVKDKEKGLIDTTKTNKYEVHRNIGIFSGLDFGFNPDPCAMVLFYHHKNTKRLYIYQEYYRAGKTARTLADELLQFEEIDSYCPVVADAARPEMVAELKRRGINIRGSRKPRVLDDIGRLQDFEIFVHPRCTNLISELSLYSWKQNRQTEEILNVPEDRNNHLIDALRYGTQNISILEKREYKVFNNFKMG